MPIQLHGALLRSVLYGHHWVFSAGGPVGFVSSFEGVQFRVLATHRFPCNDPSVAHGTNPTFEGSFTVMNRGVLFRVPHPMVIMICAGCHVHHGVILGS